MCVTGVYKGQITNGMKTFYYMSKSKLSLFICPDIIYIVLENRAQTQY